jgi:vacuolar protein sorting-associated protein 54
VNAALILVKLVGEYLNCLSLIPSLSTDVLQKVVELLRCASSPLLPSDYRGQGPTDPTNNAPRGRHSRGHSLFNSRTCGLVLGAGAMQAASLKSITAKHLCTYTRAASFVRIRVRSAKKREKRSPLPCTKNQRWPRRAWASRWR